MPVPAWAAGGLTAVGFVLLGLAGFVYLVSGLVVPLPWLIGLWGVWVALAVHAVRRRRQPWTVLATAGVAAVVWVAVVSLGGALLDWTA